MDKLNITQVEVDAATSLAEWTSSFVDGVHSHAKQLAARSSHPHLITASQYRQAALAALQSLSKCIAGEIERDDHRTAA